MFRRLEQEPSPDWPARLLGLAHGLQEPVDPGPFSGLSFEYPVNASPERLQWLREHARELRHPDEKLERMLRRLESSEERLQVFEGTTYADCLIECERALIWVEGKRTDWLSPGTSWDPARDQLARNLEAAWITATEKQKDYCVLLCHENDLRKAEQDLVEGYRSGALLAGVPHLDESVRREFERRIGTVTWREIVDAWPELRSEPLLADC